MRRRRIRALATLLSALVLALVLVLTFSGGSRPRSTVHRPLGGARTLETAKQPSIGSIEAGVEPWQLPSPLSRQAVVATGSNLTVLGGLTPAGTSVASVFSLNVASGQLVAAGTLPDPVHDAAASLLGKRLFVFGGGSPATVSMIQSIAASSVPLNPPISGSLSAPLPAPRSDLGTATIQTHKTRTTYIVGGYDGANGERDVLATTDGIHFNQVATLRDAVRYPAVVAYGGHIYVLGGESPSGTDATSDIQRVDPSTRTTKLVGHLPQPLYGAAAFVLNGTIYVAGGQILGGITLTRIDAFIPRTSRVLNAGLLPQAVAFGGYATVGTGSRAVGYIVGGEVSGQAGPDQAGIASGTLQTVLSLRISPYGGAAGPSFAGAPFSGTLLVADRGNNQLLAMTPSRAVIWQYPSATMPPPPGGFYFPDDAFFIRQGSGIISNQEDNHTIVEIGYPSGKILWQYGHPGQPGSAPGYLNQPDDAYLLKDGTVTVADASNNRILFISPAGQVVDQIGNGVDAHVPGVSVAYPNGDTPLADGDVLVSEITGNYIDEYTRSGVLVWSVHIPSVNYPSDPQQLGPNLFLTCDYDPPAEGKVLEFNRSGTVLWDYDVTAGDAMLKKPSLAERLPNGLIMVNDDYRQRVVVIDPATHEIVWQYGLTDVPGTAPGSLSIPDGFDVLLANHTTPTHPTTG